MGLWGPGYFEVHLVIRRSTSSWVTYSLLFRLFQSLEGPFQGRTDTERLQACSRQAFYHAEKRSTVSNRRTPRVPM